jgi:hypothetical protein
VRAAAGPTFEGSPEAANVAEPQLLGNLLEFHIAPADPLFGPSSTRFVEQSLK